MDLKPAQRDILLALGRCKFLTVGQMMDLGIRKQRENLNRDLKAMRDLSKPPVANKNFASDPKAGKLESVHYLTEHGEKLLIEAGIPKAEIRRPIGNSSLFYKDYSHRRNTIDIQVAMLKEEQAGKGRLVFFDSYFDQEGNNRKDHNARSKTKIDLEDGSHLIADAVALWETSQGEKQLFAIEMYNGNDSGRVERQLQQHLLALSEGKLGAEIQEEYGLETGKGHRVLCVFEQVSNMQAVWLKLAADPDYEFFRTHFLAKPYSILKSQSFSENWLNLEGVEQKL